MYIFFLTMVCLGVFLPFSIQASVKDQRCYISDPDEFYVENMDFSGNYPQMQVMKLHAERQKRVALDLSGTFPVLEKIDYHGTFGNLQGKLTGRYDHLSMVSINCTACKIFLDCRGDWKTSSYIHVSNKNETIELVLPQDVFLNIRTKGKVVIQGPYKKKGRGIFLKTFVNKHDVKNDVVLDINVESLGGNIILR